MKDFFRSKVFIAYLAVLFFMIVFPPYVAKKVTARGAVHITERGHSFLLSLPSTRDETSFVDFQILFLQIIAVSVIALLIYTATERRGKEAVTGSALAEGGEEGGWNKWEGWSETETANLYRLAVGDKGSDYYLNSFFDLEKTGSYRYALSWNWAAFIFNWLWLLYRKMYLGCGVFVLALFATAYLLSSAGALWGEAFLLSWLFSSIILGVLGNSLYLFQARSCIKWAQMARDTEEGVAQYLKSRGGASMHPFFALLAVIIFVVSHAFWEGLLKAKRKASISFRSEEVLGIEPNPFDKFGWEGWSPDCKEKIGFDFTRALAERYLNP